MTRFKTEVKASECVPEVTHPVHNSKNKSKAQTPQVSSSYTSSLVIFQDRAVGVGPAGVVSRHLSATYSSPAVNSSSWSGFVTQLPRDHNPIYFCCDLTETKRLNFNDECLAFLYVSFVMCTMKQKVLKCKGFGRNVCNFHAVNTV